MAIFLAYLNHEAKRCLRHNFGSVAHGIREEKKKKKKKKKKKRTCRGQDEEERPKRFLL